MSYKAFISYSHAADGKLAPALQHALHRIAKPWYRLRSMRVFRDQTNLSASPGLWSAIEAALRDSEYFLFMASPSAAQSVWVRKEADWWLSNRSAQTFLIVLTEGELRWDDSLRDFDWSVTTALPRRLSGAFAEEPLFVDLRWVRTTEQFSVRHSQFRPAVLELAAPLLGRSKDELDGDDIREYRRTRRIAQAAVATLLALFIAVVGAAIVAVQQRDLAMARALASSAEAVRLRNPELALLLADEARRTKADDQVRYVLRESLVAHPQRVLQAAPRGRTVLAAFLGSDFVISADRDGHEATVWSLPAGLRIADLPTESVGDGLAVSRSADGAFVALQTGNDTFSVYAVKDWRRVAELSGHNPRFNPKGDQLLATAGGRIARWMLPSLAPLAFRRPPPDGAAIQDISLDGRLLLARPDDDAAPAGGWVISAESGELVARLPASVGLEYAVFSPDGTRFVAANAERSALVIWDARSGRPLRSLQGDLGWVEQIAWSPDGHRIITGSRDGTPRLWSAENGELVAGLPFHSNRISAVRFSPDGQVILSASVDGTACLWDADSFRCLAEFGGRSDDVWDADVAADSRQFLTTHLDGSVRLWHRETWYPTQAVATLAQRPLTALGAGGRWLASVGEKGRVQLRGMASGALKTTLGDEHEEVQRIAVNPSGTIIAVAPAKHPVQLWDVATGAKLRELGKPPVEITALAFSPDGEGLLVGGMDGALHYWNVANASVIQDLTGWTTPEGGPVAGDDGGLKASVRALEFGPGGDVVVVATGAVVQLRRLATGEVLLQADFPGDSDFVNGVGLSADGRSLCIASGKAVQIWDVANASPRQSLTGFSDEAFSCAFSPDGQFLATGSGYLRASGGPPPDGNEVRIWDIRTGRDFLRYRSAAHVVDRLFFGADATTLLAASLDGFTRKYRCEVCIPFTDLERLAKQRISRELSADERSRYVP